MKSEVDRHLFVVLGAAGDHSRKKLIPEIYRLLEERNLKEQSAFTAGISPTLLEPEL